MSPVIDPDKSGPRYWRSLDDLAQTPEFREFMHREFPAGASEMLDSGERRTFLKIMAASFALAGLGLTGCRRWPEQQIAPFSRRPEGRAPGIPVYYATTREIDGCATGLLATSFDGRPIKVDGNPLHPTNGNAAAIADLSPAQQRLRRHGSTDAIGQASILDLYDPDRSRSILEDGAQVSRQTWEQWAKPHFEKLRADNGQGLAILSEPTASPSMMAMKQAIASKLKNATWHEYTARNNDNEINGAKLAFGRAWRPQYAFDKAKAIVTFDSDFLLNQPDSLRFARDFARTRRIDGPDGKMSRMHAFESALSLTGSNADHRTAMNSRDVARACGWLASKIAPGPATSGLDEGVSPEVQAALEQAQHDLEAHRGEGIIIAGPGQPAEVHMLVHLMNAALKNHGSTIEFTPLSDTPANVESLKALVERVKAGEVSTLLILGGNPVYDAPADLNFAEAIGSNNVEHTIHLANYVDETSRKCGWHLNQAHYLEAWGDGRSYDGTVSICQPLIEPLFDGQSAIEVLALVTGDEKTAGYDIVRRTFVNMTGRSDPEKLWRRTLHDGVLAGSAFTRERPPIRSRDMPFKVQSLANKLDAADGGIEVVFTTDSSVYDGRFANNGWLQELPDPISKLTWDNAVMLAPSTAKSLGVKTGDKVNVTVGQTTVEAAVLEQPGQATGTAVLSLGYGRKFDGRICAHAGFDFYPLRTCDAMWIATGQIEKSRGKYKFAITQDHHTIGSIGFKGTQERLPSLVRESSLAHYKEHPDFAKHAAHVTHRLSLWSEKHPYHSEEGFPGAEYAWAMSIDLSTCTGCSACVIACQAENNIPIVGKEQVRFGREMHWIRIDRYYRFDEDNTNPHFDHPDGVALQPVACQMCENAPCEQVCPVAATLHDEDGLNVMVYNRCVGTRYCSNNCPYKVRRFNYFDYHRRKPRRDPGLLAVDPGYYTRPQAAAETLHQLQFNPEVTVRPRGVMEKCTYCTQRIEEAKINAKNEWIKLPEAEKKASDHIEISDGTIVPACAQACPTEAIVFGNLLDKESRVSKLQRDDRSYGMLEELNVKPRTQYLARITNPGNGDHVDSSSEH